MGILRHIAEVVGIKKREKAVTRQTPQIIKLMNKKMGRKPKTEHWDGCVKVPGNIRRKMLGSKVFKEERDDNED